MLSSVSNKYFNLRYFSRTIASRADELLSALVDHERTTIPPGSGADCRHGFDLDRVHRLLDDLGRPQDDLRAVHIAGTKGKGSVAAMLSSILCCSGYKVGTYTSPHVVHWRERIAINLEPISEASLDRLALQSSPAIQGALRREAAALSWFEAVTALALKHFSEQQVDLVVLETGLGGVRDATNVLRPDCLELSIITALGLEHQQALGSTLEEIAAAKAGICKPGKLLVAGPQPLSEAMAILHKQARARGSPVLEASQAVHVSAKEMSVCEQRVEQDMQICSRLADHLNLDFVARMQLVGEQQAENASTAVAAALQLAHSGWSAISAASVQLGLQQAALPGRFQAAKLGEGQPWLLLDGAHTAQAAAGLSKSLRQAFPAHSLAFIVAMAADKDHAGVMAALRAARPVLAVFTSCPIAGATIRYSLALSAAERLAFSNAAEKGSLKVVACRSAPPGMLAANWQAASFTEERPLRSREVIQANLASAVEFCRRELFSAPGEGVICITGSLHAVAAALALPDLARLFEPRK